MRSWLLAPVFGALLVGCGGSTNVGTANVRALNAITGSTGMHIGAEGQEFGVLDFGADTDFQQITAAWSTFYVSQDGKTNLATQDLTPSDGDSYTAVALGKPSDTRYPIQISLFRNDITVPAAGYTKFRLLNACTNQAGGVDLYLTDSSIDLTNLSPTISGVAWGDISGYITPAASSNYAELRITRKGQKTAIYDDPTFEMTSGKIRTLALIDNGTGVNVLEMPEY